MSSLPHLFAVYQPRRRRLKASRCLSESGGAYRCVEVCVFACVWVCNCIRCVAAAYRVLLGVGVVRGGGEGVLERVKACWLARAVDASSSEPRNEE